MTLKRELQLLTVAELLTDDVWMLDGALDTTEDWEDTDPLTERTGGLIQTALALREPGNVMFVMGASWALASDVSTSLCSDSSDKLTSHISGSKSPALDMS